MDRLEKIWECLGCRRKENQLKEQWVGYIFSSNSNLCVCIECEKLENKIIRLLERKFSLDNLTPHYKIKLQDYLQEALNYNLIHPLVVCNKCGMRQGDNLVGWKHKNNPPYEGRSYCLHCWDAVKGEMK